MTEESIRRKIILAVFLALFTLIGCSETGGVTREVSRDAVKIAKERGSGRLEGWCLDWNKPSIDFYLSLGAEPKDEWTTYRVTGENLNKLAEE